MTTCPVLVFTPKIMHAIKWFDETHELIEKENGRNYWKRVSLPGPGVLAEQDYQLMEAMDLLRAVHNNLLLKHEDARS